MGLHKIWASEHSATRVGILFLNHTCVDQHDSATRMTATRPQDKKTSEALGQVGRTPPQYQESSGRKPFIIIRNVHNFEKGRTTFHFNVASYSG